MTYDRFEDLTVWQEAMRLARGVYDPTEHPTFKIGFSLRDQIERSSMSVSDKRASVFNLPGFQTLPKGVKRMLLVSEAHFFEQPAPHVVKRTNGLQATGASKAPASDHVRMAFALR